MTAIRKVVLLVNPSRRYTRGLLTGIAKYARLHGNWAFYRPLEYRDPAARRRLLPALETLRPDGIFMREPPEFEAIIRMNLPTISFGYSSEKIDTIPTINVDHNAVGHLGAKHFLERGFCNFAYCGFDDWWWSQRRCEGFCQTVEEAGYSVHVYRSQGRRGVFLGDEFGGLASWLRSLPKSIGILACNDDRGEHVIEACKTAGVEVPHQVAVLGVDDDHLICDLCHPPLSSISLNLERTGYDSAALLDKMMDGSSGMDVNFDIKPTHVVTRRSTDILAVEDEDVALAVYYIRNRAQKKIDVHEVVQQGTVSRRVLEKRFRRTLGSSIHAEIRRARVEQLVKLLVETQLSISEIASILDFEDATHLSRYFRKEKGISPLQYRKQRV